MEEKTPRSIRVGTSIAGTKFGKWMCETSLRLRVVLLVFNAFTHSLYWLTSWWSPWPYIIYMVFWLWLGQGFFKQWAIVISQAMQPEWDPAILKISMPFIVCNYVAIFACLYMFGTVVDGNGNPINGMWQHFYFSAVTLTTLGYGNLTPSGTFSEVVATVEAVIGFMAFAVLAGVVASIVLKRVEINDKA